ncbi:MAG TPA: urate oxidase [Candidatus Dormibacteraeota bacterium]|nr:urate oxidase [Candidatus Dormibacteraeota bacterium]
MTRILLGDNQYGKAETHIVRVTKAGPEAGRAQGHTPTTPSRRPQRRGLHDIKDMTVSVALAGDFASTHLTGDNSKVVPTDTQKNTVFAFAKQSPVGEVEEFALRLARHFVSDYDSVQRARVSIAEQPWARIRAGGRPHPHAFERAGSEKRLTAVTCTRNSEWVVSGLSELTLLKSTGSEFWGYSKDRYTTLPETRDRVLATAIDARWRYTRADIDWAAAHAEARRVLIETFATQHSLSLQQTLYMMGEAVLQARPEIAEIRFSMANKHHFVVDLKPLGLENDNEVFYASDRPYGLIEGTVTRDDAPPADHAW